MYQPQGRTIGYLRAAFRRIWRWSRERAEALRQARNDKGLFKCGKCGKWHTKQNITVHHIESVISTKDGFVDWQVYFERMFVPVEKLLVICKKCHKKETDREKKERKKTNDTNKA